MSKYRIVKGTEAIIDPKTEMWRIPYRIQKRGWMYFPLIRHWKWVMGDFTITITGESFDMFTETKREPVTFWSEEEALQFVSEQFAITPDQEIGWDIIKELHLR